MSTTIYPNVGALNCINDLRTMLEDCTLDLFQNDYNPSPSTVVGDLTVATFSGYTAKTVTALLPAYIDPEGGASAQIATQQWDHTGGAVANTVYGFYLKTTGGDLIMVGRFDEGIPMVAIGDSIPLDVKIRFTN